jgi:hypothetical protein
MQVGSSRWKFQAVMLTLKFWLFRVFCEEVFTAEAHAAAPQPKESGYFPQRRKGRKEREIIFIRTWRSSRLGGRNIRIRDASYIGKFTQAAKTFKHRQSSQRSENFLFKNSFTLRPEPVLSDVEGRLRGAISESCFTGKPEDPISALVDSGFA